MSSPAVVYVLSTVTGYVLTSALLLRCPSLLHRRRRETFRSRHISHRGGAGENLENTMAAFRHAVELGTDMLELDCHLTKDEQVVVLHDSNLRRLTGVDADISDVRYADLPPYLCKLGVTFKRECFVEGGGSRRIPLLRDVFEAFPSLPINIDIKVNDDRLIRKVSEMVIKYDREHLTVWGNSRDQIVQKCYKEVRALYHSNSHLHSYRVDDILVLPHGDYIVYKSLMFCSVSYCHKSKQDSSFCFCV
uniref:GP-PDE domain-containing protein n=1 Tax=Electrophorus electricus TaxID=8005 RepID=A0A4W4FMT1_ELEEL